MKWLLIIVCALFLFGCKTAKEARQQKKAEKYYNQNPGELAKVCAIKYPVTAQLKRGETIIFRDSITLVGDSVPCPPNAAGKVVKVPCEQKVIMITEHRTDTLYKENTARLDVCMRENRDLFNSNKELIQELEKVQGKKRLYFWILIAIAAAFIGKLLFKLLP